MDVPVKLLLVVLSERSSLQLEDRSNSCATLWGLGSITGLLSYQLLLLLLLLLLQLPALRVLTILFDTPACLLEAAAAATGAD
jgi:hypothetical protein